jgi:outer membrane protein OmpA-like peptidoglycan-associated protein
MQRVLKAIAIVVLLLSPTVGSAAPSDKSVGDNKNALLDVISVYNGGYALGKDGKGDDGNYANIRDQMSLINSILASRAQPEFMPDKGSGTVKRKDLVFELSAPATIESFRIRGSVNPTVPQRVEFAISQFPQTDFKVIAVYDVPEKYRSDWKGSPFDFSIPVNQNVSGRYVRLTMLNAKQGYFGLRYFNAYGRFDQPAKLQNFNGIYSASKFESDGGSTEADSTMVFSSDKTKNPYIVLHQQEGQIQGCYVLVDTEYRGKDIQAQSILGKFSGGAEGNLYRFTRTYAKDGSQRSGVITLSPDGKAAHLAMLNEIKPGDKKDGFYRLALKRVSDQPIPCATSAEKEKTAAEAMQESLDKTGKVQLYGVNFDFDSDVLRPESSAVLNDVVKLAKANPTLKFEIAGHTDSTGTAAYNQSLSERRAASVVRFLTQAGVPTARLTSRGYGANRPLIANDANSEAARAQNRRVELVKQ